MFYYPNSSRVWNKVWLCLVPLRVRDAAPSVVALSVNQAFLLWSAGKTFIHWLSRPLFSQECRGGDSPGRLEIPHGQQKSQIVLQVETKAGLSKVGNKATPPGRWMILRRLSRAYASGGLWGWNPPLSLIFYKNFISCSKEINAFCLLICRLNANTTE